MDDYSLLVVLGPAAGTQIKVVDELLIGRRASGPGRLEGDSGLSRRHAVIRRSDSRLTIVDLGSANGTRVNDRLLSGEIELHPGDRISVGGSAIEVRPARTAPSESGPAAAAPAPAHAPSTPARRGADQAVPPLALPEVDRRGDRRGRSVSEIVLAAIATAALAACVILIATRPPGAGGPAAPFDGTAYVETNVADPNANSVLALRYDDGAFRPLHIVEYPTGGSGSHDMRDRGVLDADQQVTVNAARTLLFAVNQGSDSIAAFHIAADGSLSPVVGSPFASGGTAPTSLGISGNILVVADKAYDGVRDLTRVQANYTTFRVAADGSLHPTGSTFLLPPRAAPTQVYIAPGGRLVFTTEETGTLRAFRLTSNGTLIQAPDSPVSLPNTLFAVHQRPHPVWPAGLSANPDHDILYSGIPNYGTIVAYDYDSTGRLVLDGEEADPKASLPCWSVVSPDGRTLYFDNAGSDNISVWDIATDPRHPRRLQTLHLRGGGNPWNLSLDPDGHYLYTITPRQVGLLIPAGQGQLLHSLRIAPNGTLTELPASPVPLPVALRTNPIGLAVVPHR